VRPVYVGRLPSGRGRGRRWVPARVWVVLGGAAVVGLASGSARLGQALVLGAVVWPVLGACWWRAVRLLSEYVSGRGGDVFGLAHAWRTWPELGPHLGLATVDPRTARQVLPTQRGAVGALILNPGEAAWVVPRLAFRLTGWGFAAEGRLVAGMVPADFAERVPALVHAWNAHSIRVDSPRRGWVRLTVLRRDPLAVPVPALPVGEPVDLAGC
jgi:hypothetical protein